MQGSSHGWSLKSYSSLIVFTIVGDGDDRFPVYYGTIAGVPCVCMGKRYHFYQGYTPAQTAIPMALMKALGIEMAILSNAAGGINSSFHVGDLMMIKDHISFLGLSGNNPLVVTGCDVWVRWAATTSRWELASPRFATPTMKSSAGFSALRWSRKGSKRFFRRVFTSVSRVPAMKRRQSATFSDWLGAMLRAWAQSMKSWRPAT